MKIRFFSTRLFISLILWSTVDASHAISKGYREIPCTISRIDEKDNNRTHPHIPGPRSQTRAQQTSTNWGGYVGAANINSPTQNSVSEVYGSWIVPTIVSAGGNTYSALWIGIDGYTSSTVEQIGTSHNFINGKQQHYAWFEMYPGPSYRINGFPLTPGDVISASVVYSGNNIFTMTLSNDTQKVTTTIPTSYTQSSIAERSSAEWIIEAPYSNGILPLSNFKTAYMWGCFATINGIFNAIQNNSWQNVSLEMVTNSGASKAIPSSLLQDDGSFFTLWKHK